MHVDLGDVHDFGVEAVDGRDAVLEIDDLGELFDEPQVGLRFDDVHERIVVDGQWRRFVLGGRGTKPDGQND